MYRVSKIFYALLLLPSSNLIDKIIWTVSQKLARYTLNAMVDFVNCDTNFKSETEKINSAVILSLLTPTKNRGSSLLHQNVLFSGHQENFMSLKGHRNGTWESWKLRRKELCLPMEPIGIRTVWNRP